MTPTEHAGDGLHGLYRDVIRGPSGEVVVDSGWVANAIAGDFHRLLAAVVRGDGNTNGLIGLQVGAGASAWDSSGTPTATPAQTKLVDPNPYEVPVGSLKIDYLDGGVVAGDPTSRLQIKATLGPNVPPSPWPNHATSDLREFGLVGRLRGDPMLVNYVTHTVIAKDPASTLERTIWLQF